MAKGLWTSAHCIHVWFCPKLLTQIQKRTIIHDVFVMLYNYNFNHCNQEA